MPTADQVNAFAARAGARLEAPIRRYYAALADFARRPGPLTGIRRRGAKVELIESMTLLLQRLMADAAFLGTEGKPLSPATAAALRLRFAEQARYLRTFLGSAETMTEAAALNRIHAYVPAIVQTISLGTALGRHPTPEEAEAQIAALYAAEDEQKAPANKAEVRNGQGNGGYCWMARIADDERIKVLRSAVMARFPSGGFMPLDPATLHVTLVYSEDALPANYTPPTAVTDAFPVMVEAVDQFDTPDGYAIHLRVRRAPPLTTVQEALHASMAGMALSPYSTPADYKPHITLGYAATPIEPFAIDPFTLTVREIMLSDPQEQPVIQLNLKSKAPMTGQIGLTRWGIVEYKSGPLYPQTVDENERTVTGYAAMIGNVDDGDDRLHHGAFAKTLRESGKRVRHLWQHSLNEPPTAVITALREVSTKELPGDLLREHPNVTGALEVTRKYLNTPRADEILQGITAGAITEMSFGYQIPKGRSDVERTKDGRQIRNLREVRLMETSDVLFGMNPATRTMKGLSADVLRNMLRSQDVLRLLQAGQRVTAEDLAAYERVLIVLEEMLAAPVAVQDVLLEAESTGMEDVPPPPPSDDMEHMGRKRSPGLLALLAISEREMALWT